MDSERPLNPLIVVLTSSSLFLFLIYFLFGTFHLILFTLSLVVSYYLTDRYARKTEETKCFWPNLLIFFQPKLDENQEFRRKLNRESDYIKKNPWVNLMVAKSINAELEQFGNLCLRDFVYSWLSTITQDDGVVHEIKHLVRFFLATLIRRAQNENFELRNLVFYLTKIEKLIVACFDIKKKLTNRRKRLFPRKANFNRLIVEQLVPLTMETFDRYIEARKQNRQLNSAEFFRRAFGNDFHPALLNRRNEYKYLRNVVDRLLTILTVRTINECGASKNFVREMFVTQVFLNGIDSICQPATINRAIENLLSNLTKKNSNLRIENEPVELLKDFISINGPLHKNQLSVDFSDVMYEKELLNQFSRVLDRHGSIGLLSIYLTLTDVLNEIPLASEILVRRKIHQRLKRLTQRYFDPNSLTTFLSLSNPLDSTDSIIRDFQFLVERDFESSLDEKNPSQFDPQRLCPFLSKIQCRIYDLLEEKYHRCFINSDEDFFYICGRRIEASDYSQLENSFDAIALDFVHIEEIRTTNNGRKNSQSKAYTTTSYKELEEKDQTKLKNLEETLSISSSMSIDERDMSLWKVRITEVEEMSDSSNSSAKHFFFTVEVQKIENSSENKERNSVITRRYEDFYLLEQKLNEFHGIFSDARLPNRRSTRNLEFFHSIRPEFENFLNHLISKPTLRNSELLFNFLTQPEEFCLPNGEINLAKMFKVVPRRLRIEKGQCLEPFLVALLNFAEPTKPRSTQSAPILDDFLGKKLFGSIYGNNAELEEKNDENIPQDDDPAARLFTVSFYDKFLSLAKKLFDATAIFVEIFDFLRIPFKNSFDAFFAVSLENRIEQIFQDEQFFLNAIRSLKTVLFPRDFPQTNPTEEIRLSELVSRTNFLLPDFFKRIFGEQKTLDALEILLEFFQNPLLNKQLFYSIFDEILLELFPELNADSVSSR